MKKLLLITLVTTLGLSACGVKGPLHFPEQAPKHEQK